MGRSTSSISCKLAKCANSAKFILVLANEPYLSCKYENTATNVTADLTTTYDAEMNTSLACRKNQEDSAHSFEGGANRELN